MNIFVTLHNISASRIIRSLKNIVQLKRLCFAVILIFLTNIAVAQDISGYVRNSINGIGIENATVKVKQDLEGAEETTTITNAYGYYEFYDIITALQDHPLSQDKLKLVYNGTEIIATVRSNINPREGRVVDLLGRTLTIVKYEPTGSFQEYQAKFVISDWTAGILFLIDQAGHQAKLISGFLPYNGTQLVDYAVEKSASKDKSTFIIEADDDEQKDEYQSKKDTLDVNKGDIVDIRLDMWPNHILNFHFNVEDRTGNGLQNATINVEELANQDLRYTRISDADGKASIYNIPVGHEEGNKLNPKNTNWLLNVSKGGYDLYNDTLWHKTTGDEYPVIILTEESSNIFYADLFTTITNENDGSVIQGVNAKLWKTGSTDSLNTVSGLQGQANFLNIEIPSNDGTNPDNVNYGLSLKKEGFEDFSTNLSLTEGTFHKYFQLTEDQTTPTEFDFVIVINTKDTEGNYIQNIDWEIRNQSNEILDSGNSGNNASDTAIFANVNSSLNIVINTSGGEYTYATKNQTVNAGQTSITTINELMTYLYEWKVFVKDSQTESLLDSVNVKAYQNNQLLLELNGGSNTVVEMQTTQPGHELELGLLIQRNGYETPVIQNVTVQEGEINEFTYSLTQETTTPTEEDYLVIIQSKDENGNALQNTEWRIEDLAKGTVWTGNTGSNSLDTLEFTATNSTINASVQSSKTGYEDYNTTTSFNSGTNNITTSNQLITYTYSITIVSKDENGNLLQNADWSFRDISTNNIWTGNTGTNGTDVLEYEDTDQNSDIELTISKEEYLDDLIVTNIQSGQNTTLTSDNLLVKYLYQAQVMAQNSETENNLDSINVRMFFNGELVDQQNSLNNFWVNLEMMAPNHAQEVSFIIDRVGYVSDTVNVTLYEGETNEFLYSLTKASVEPDNYSYTVIIHAKDENGDNLGNASWVFKELEYNRTWYGNVNEEGLDSLEFSGDSQSIGVELIVEKNGYNPDTVAANLTGNETKILTSSNSQFLYTYNIEVYAIDAVDELNLDSLVVKMYHNGELVEQTNSYNTTVAAFQWQNHETTQQVEFEIQRNGYEIYHSDAEWMWYGNTVNQFTYSMVKIQDEPDSTVAYLWRGIWDPNQSGAVCNVTIWNDEFNYHDTRLNQRHDIPWRDTVPVHAEGATIYNVKIEHVHGTGDQDLYTLEKTFELTQNQTAQGYDYLEAIRQELRLKGRVMDAVTRNNVGGYTIIIKDDNGSVVETLNSSDGNYVTQMLPVGFEGSMDVRKNGDDQYFGHENIYILPREVNFDPDLAGPYLVSPNGTGPVLLKSELNRFEDTIKIYNIGLIPTVTQDPKTGESKAVNFDRLTQMDGTNSYYLPTLKDWPINVHFEGIPRDPLTQQKKEWAQTVFNFINDDFGIPLVLNEIEEPLPENGIVITSLDDDYLNSIKNQTGMNMEVSERYGGIAFRQGQDDIDEIAIHTSSNIRIRNGESIMIGENYSGHTIVALREILHRTFHTTEYNGAVSVSNGSTPLDMTEEDMIGERTYYHLIYHLRKGRALSNPLERINSRTRTIVEQ